MREWLRNLARRWQEWRTRTASDERDLLAQIEEKWLKRSR